MTLGLEVPQVWMEFMVNLGLRDRQAYQELLAPRVRRVNTVILDPQV